MADIYRVEDIEDKKWRKRERDFDRGIDEDLEDDEDFENNWEG